MITEATIFLRNRQLSDEKRTKSVSDTSQKLWAKQKPAEINDVQLMGQIAHGDAAALELLYDRYSPSVMGLAVKMLGDRTAAEEVVQETFWKVWRNAASFRQKRGNVSSWLFGIARNLAIDNWRRRKARPQAVLDDKDVSETDIDARISIDESVWTKIKHSQVRSAIASLPTAQRRVIELAYFGGLTRQEISDQMDVPLGTVHTRARLGLQKLREALQSQGFED